MRNKYFRITIIIFSILLICNIVIMAHLFSAKSNAHKHIHKENKCFLKSKLDLTEEESIIFDSIKHKYRCKAKQMDCELKSHQRDLILMIYNDSINSEKKSEIKERIILLQDSLLEITLQQYYEYKCFLDSSKQAELTDLYMEMFGCDYKCHKK